MSLTADLCKTFAETIASHDGQVDSSEIVGALLTTVSAYSRSTLGVNKTLLLMAVQMSVISEGNLDKVQSFIDAVNKSQALTLVNVDINKMAQA